MLECSWRGFKGVAVVCRGALLRCILLRDTDCEIVCGFLEFAGRVEIKEVYVTHSMRGPVKPSKPIGIVCVCALR